MKNSFASRFFLLAAVTLCGLPASGQSNRALSAVLLDANGTLVGVPLVTDPYGASGGVIVSGRDGRGFLLTVTNGNFINGGDEIYYQSSNCTGTPFVQKKVGVFDRSGEGPGRRIYAARVGVAPSLRTYYSIFGGGPGAGCQPQPTPGTSELVPADRAGIDLDRFTPPFTVYVR